MSAAKAGRINNNIIMLHSAAGKGVKNERKSKFGNSGTEDV